MIFESSSPCPRIRRSTGLLLGVLLLLGLGPRPAPAQHAHGHAEGSGPPDADARPEQATDTPLRQPGNAAFAAIQEVVAELNARPDTDWSRVDLEALRQHLVDMRRFTLHAEVVERTQIDGGLRVAVRGPDSEIHRSLRRSLRAHAPMLERETGWSVSVAERGDRLVLEATSDRPDEAERIRGLGYVGLMATGSHHQRHHWLIATGRSPHGPGQHR